MFSMRSNVVPDLNVDKTFSPGKRGHWSERATGVRLRSPVRFKPWGLSEGHQIPSRRCPALALIVVLSLVVVMCPGQTCFSAENVWSVQKLNLNKPWEKYIESTMRIEGRVGSFGGGQLRLLRCEAKFTVDNAKLRSVGPKNTVELTGRFKKEGSKLEFVVSDLKVVPGYAEQFESRALKLKRASGDEWSELGDWVSRLSQFYDDAELMKKADEAYTRAIDAQYESLKPTDAKGRIELARKIEEWKLPVRRKMELIHEGLRVQWQVLQKVEPPDPAAWQTFADELKDQLEGTQELFLKIPRDLKETYDQDPVATYRRANDDLRKQLHRLFFVAVTRKRLLHGASSDGRDGDSIAEKIEQLIPEEGALAENQRKLRLMYRLANVATATRSEAENLSALFHERAQPVESKQALTQWVKAHELRLKGDGVIGLKQLADEYLTLLKNEPDAVEYLTDAHRIDPTDEEVKSKLASLGYQWRNGRWQKGGPAKPDTPTSMAESPSGINANMTATDLRKLLGAPSSLARAITSRGITEVWCYGPAGSSRLVVRLEQKGRDTDPKVTAVSNPR
jgi:hypothetical protein